MHGQLYGIIYTIYDFENVYGINIEILFAEKQQLDCVVVIIQGFREGSYPGGRFSFFKS